jgi:hypothetical protein
MSGAHISLPTKKMLAAYPCDADLWRRLHAVGQEMVRQGSSPDIVPLRAFQHQRYRAGARGIEWKLTLAEWWAIWEESGHWRERGIGRSFMMCRIGDLGPYEVGNVFIGPGVMNLSAAAKKTNLPIGVAYRGNRKRYSKPYRAYCNVGGKQRWLGVFKTADEAHAAYLEALLLDTALKRAS